jgi:nicotinate-nucleotide adenylyltransferase
MVRIAVEDYPKLKVSNIEFDLPQPNYTVNTLIHLEEKYPDLHFSLIMGEDNLKSFHKWKNYDVISSRHSIYVYPRISKGEVLEKWLKEETISLVDAPIMEVSSSFIRKSIQQGKNFRPLLPHSVWTYLDEMNFYK